MADTATTPRPRPEKPDEEKYKTDLAQAEKELKAVQEKLNALNAKLDLAKPQNKDSPTAKKQQELRAELTSIRQQQSGFKNSRTSIQDKIASLDAQLKSRISEQKANRARVPYKNVEELDSKIAKLDKDVESGQMKLVDEKKALAEITSLKKLRKNFSGFDDAEKSINDVKSQIADLRKTMDNPEARALSDRYNEIQTELDKIKAEQDDAYKNFNGLRDERTKLKDEQQTKWDAKKSIQDTYFQGRKAHRDYEQELWKARQERKKAENEAYAKEKRKKAAAARLEEASSPAYMDEIMTAEGLIKFFDPSSVSDESKALRGPSGFAAEAQRTVDDSKMKGTVLTKKDDRDDTYFMGTGGKKGKKGKKTPAPPAPGTPTEGKFNLSIGVIEELAKINIDPPSSQSDVPEVVEKLKAKATKWRSEQSAKTKENVAKAQAEIDRLESDASNATTNGTHDTAKKPALANSGVTGESSASAELAQEEDAVKDAAEEMEKAKIEDAQEA